MGQLVHKMGFVQTGNVGTVNCTVPYAENTKNCNPIELVSPERVQMCPLFLKRSFIFRLSIPRIQMQESNSRQKW